MAFLGRGSGRDEARAARYAAWFARQHPLALASILLAGFSLTHFGVLLVDEVLAIVLGTVALRQIARSRRGDFAPGEFAPGAAPRTEGTLLAAGAIAVGTVSLALAAWAYWPRRA